MLINITNPFIDWMFPKRCLICDADEPRMHMCRICLMQCHRNQCQTFSINGEQAFLFHFELSIGKIIRKAKYNNDILSAHILCALVIEELQESSLLAQIKQFSPEAVTFVPRHFLANVFRTVELPYLFAQIIADAIDRPLVSALVKNSPFGNQARRPYKRERVKEIRDQFSASLKMPYKRILIVDDVMTTGATLREVRRVLFDQGIETKSMAIAKTP